jgi:hypothetical protein
MLRNNYIIYDKPYIFLRTSDRIKYVLHCLGFRFSVTGKPRGRYRKRTVLVNGYPRNREIMAAIVCRMESAGYSCHYGHLVDTIIVEAYKHDEDLEGSK